MVVVVVVVLVIIHIANVVTIQTKLTFLNLYVDAVELRDDMPSEAA
jgi:hypothetical protein